MSTAEPRQTRSVTIGFSVPKTEKARLDHLAQVFSDGNKSAFLRLAMDRMEVADCAQRLRDLQAYGSKRLSDLGVSTDEISDRVKRVLARRAGV